MLISELDEYKPVESIKPKQLVKKSEELRVLALLYYVDFDKYGGLELKDAPDLQFSYKIGIEVTSSENTNDRKASGIYESYRKGRTDRISTPAELNAKLSEYGAVLLIDQKKRTPEGVMTLGTENKLRRDICWAIEAKVEKAAEYEGFEELDLAVIINYAFSSTLKNTWVEWMKGICSTMNVYDNLFLVFDDGIARYFINEEILEFFSIDKDNLLRIKKISRLTAEGRIELKDQIWTICGRQFKE